MADGDSCQLPAPSFQFPASSPASVASVVLQREAAADSYRIISSYAHRDRGRPCGISAEAAPASRRWSRLGHDVDDRGTLQRRADRLPADLRRRRAARRRRPRGSRHRRRRQRPGRADRRQQGPRRARRALQRSLHGPHVARAQRRQRARHRRPHRRRSAWPTRSSRCGSTRRSRAERHQRRVDQIADIREEGKQ